MAPIKAPRRARFGSFVHLLARNYMDYPAAVRKAAKRRPAQRAVDIDTQRSKNGTGWALHWGTLGKNKLHDPKKIHHPNTRIDHLTDSEIERMRGPQGQVPQRLSAVLALANKHGVRAEVELKDTPNDAYMKRLMERPYVKSMNRRGDLQFKTLAWMGAPNGPIERLAVAHKYGGKTMLSFTDFGRRKGISKSKAWPVVDYVRGRPKWTA